MTLLKRLQDTRAWLTETKGAKHVSPKLTLAELDRVIGALQQIENRVHDPKRSHPTAEEIESFIKGAKQEIMRKRLNNCA